MEQMVTAKEFIETHNRLNDSSTELLMIEFARLHVKAALDNAAKTRKNGFYDSSKEEQSILNSYPLNKIK